MQKARHNSWECDPTLSKMTLKFSGLFFTDDTATPTNKTSKTEIQWINKIERGCFSSETCPWKGSSKERDF